MTQEQLLLQIQHLQEVVREQKEHLMMLSAQVQSLTHRTNCLSDKVSDQAVLISKIVD